MDSSNFEICFAPNEGFIAEFYGGQMVHMFNIGHMVSNETK